MISADAKQILTIPAGDQSLVLEWLNERWEHIVDRCLFGALGSPVSPDALVFTSAQVQGAWLVATQTKALSRPLFLLFGANFANPCPSAASLAAR